MKPFEALQRVRLVRFFCPWRRSRILQNSRRLHSCATQRFKTDSLCQKTESPCTFGRTWRVWVKFKEFKEFFAYGWRRLLKFLKWNSLNRLSNDNKNQFCLEVRFILQTLLCWQLCWRYRGSAVPLDCSSRWEPGICSLGIFCGRPAHATCGCRGSGRWQAQAPTSWYIRSADRIFGSAWTG